MPKLEDEAVANARFRRILTLSIRVTLLSDIYSTAGYSHGRANLTLLQSLSESTSKTMLSQLGSLHRACVWENIALKTSLASQGLEGAARPIPPSSSNESSSAQQPNVSDSSTSRLQPGAAHAANGVQYEIPSPLEQQGPTKDDSPKEKNAKALKHLASQIPSSLAPFFQGNDP